MEPDEIFEQMNIDMKKSIDHVFHEFNSLHTGKANPSMVESVTVDVYGSSMKMRDVAAITTPVRSNHGTNQPLLPLKRHSSKQNLASIPSLPES